jgi:DNA polymerase I-like protein with 3'-5' exonuclease and polymerase domains
MNYGAQGKKMAWIFECPPAKGYRFVDDYHKRFPGLTRYNERAVEYAKKHGCIWTICGRRRTLDFKKAEMQNKAKVWQLERFASNSPIQGSAADQLKIATNLCDQFLRENYPNSKVLFQIYDELLFELDLWDLNNTPISEELDHIIVNALPLFNIEFATSTEVYAIGEDGYSRWGMTEDD